MCARPRDVGRRLCLIGALVGLTLTAWAAESARVGTVRYLRDGQIDRIVFDYQGSLKYQEFKFPQALYGYLELEPAAYAEKQTTKRVGGTTLQEYTIRPVTGARQRVRLIYRLNKWVAPSFHDNGKQIEIRFSPTAAPDQPAEASDPADRSSTTSTPSTADPAASGSSIFADYLKLQSDPASPNLTTPIPSRPTLLDSSVGIQGSAENTTPLNQAQGGEGVPPAQEPTPLAAGVSSIDTLASEPATTTGNGGFAKVDTVSTPTTAGAAPKADILTPSKAYVPETAGTDSARITGARGYEFVDLDQEIFQRRINLVFKGADLQNAIRVLSRQADLNIVLDPAQVRGQITVELNDVPVGAALSSILRTNKLELIREAGGIYRVVPTRDVRRTTIETVTLIVPLNWVTANDVRGILQPIMSGNITADPIGNSVIIEETPVKIEEIINIIRRIDKPEKQVMLEARLVEMNTNLARALGVNWDLTRLDRDVSAEALTAPRLTNVPGVPQIIGFDPTNGSPITFTPDAIVEELLLPPRTNPLSRAPAAIQTALGGEGADSFNVRGIPINLPGGASWAFGSDVALFGQAFQLSALIDAAEGLDLAKVLVAPRVVTVNNQPATINVLRRIPYLTTVVGAGGVATITYNYEDIGIEMTITPNITNNDYVRMRIAPRQKILISQTGTARPTVDERYSQTNVIVKDEDTAIVAGLRQQDFTDGTQGVPWLSQIPVLGWAFKTNNRTERKTDLLAFVTPHIIKEAQILTEQEKTRYNEIDVEWDMPDYFLNEAKTDTQ